MKPSLKYLLDTIRAKGERDFVAKNEKSDSKLARNLVADNASNPSIGSNGKDPFKGPGVEPLEGAKTLHAGNLPGEDADMYEDVSPEIKEKLKKNKENKAFTVHLKHKETGKSNTTTVKGVTPDDALDKAEVKFPQHEVVKAIRQLHKEEKVLVTDVLDEAMRLSPEEKQKRDDIVNSMKKNKAEFKHRYGAKWQNVMFATATRMVTGEEIDWSNIENCDLSVEILTENYLNNIKQEVVKEEAGGISTDFSELGDGAKELIFHAENTPHLVDHQRAFINHTARLIKKGNYTPEKGQATWSHYANHAAQDYAFDHDAAKNKFSKEDKHQVAGHLANKHSERILSGIHEEVEPIDYSDLISEMRMSVIDNKPITLEFIDGTEKEIKPSKANLFLEIFDSLEEDEQEDLVSIVSVSSKTFKAILKEHNRDEMFCGNCSKSLNQHHSMYDLLDHIDRCKIARDVANRAISRQSQKDIDGAINRTSGIGMPNAVPVRG